MQYVPTAVIALIDLGFTAHEHCVVILRRK